jgi:hypothetical protein
MVSAGTRVTRIAAASCLTVATVIALAASAAGNYTYGLSQGTEEVKNLLVVQTTSAQLWGLAGVAFEIGAAFFPMVAWWAWKKRNYGIAGLSAGMAGICIFLVFTATLGFLAMERGSASANVSHSQMGYAMLEDRIASLKKQRAMVPEHRAPAIVGARISALESDTTKWKSSKQCKDVTISKVFCDEYQALQVERAASDRAAELDDKIEKARQELLTTKKVANIDGLAEFAEAVFGVSQENTNKTRLLVFATGIILLGAFGLTIVDSILSPVQAASRPAEKPVQTLSIELPPVAQPLQIEAPVIVPAPLQVVPPHQREEEKAETEARQEPDTKVKPLPQKPVTAEEGVRQWALTVEEGLHLQSDLDPLYRAYCGRRRIEMVTYLGPTLKSLGYQQRKMSKHGGRMAYLFPLATVPQKAKVKA